jgi:glutamine cyclotransferase
MSFYTYTCAENHKKVSPSYQKVVPKPKVYTYEIVNVYPHDRNAFTQGLVYRKGVLYEGTGIRGKSSLRSVELKTGKVIKIRYLPSRIFGEGITVFRDKIVQLTWNSGLGFIYDRVSFCLLSQFRYSYEGWGITHDGERLITSNGTSIIRFWEPASFAEIDQIQVHDDNGPVENLNELEYVKDEIYANVWKSDRIAMIAPNTGKVTGWIDLQGLLTLEGPAKPVDVLNGIAYDSENDRLFVTGKLWPKLFEIKLVEPQNF